MAARKAEFTPKGRIEDSKRPCVKCGVCNPRSLMNEVKTPSGAVKYICVRCL